MDIKITNKTSYVSLSFPIEELEGRKLRDALLNTNRLYRPIIYEALADFLVEENLLPENKTDCTVLLILQTGLDRSEIKFIAPYDVDQSQEVIIREEISQDQEYISRLNKHIDDVFEDLVTSVFTQGIVIDEHLLYKTRFQIIVL